MAAAMGDCALAGDAEPMAAVAMAAANKVATRKNMRQWRDDDRQRKSGHSRLDFHFASSEFQHGTYGCQVGGTPGDSGVQVPKASNRVNLGKVDLAEGVSGRP